MQLKYVKLGGNLVKFFFDQGTNEDGTPKAYGEFYLRFTKETFNAANPTDTFGVSGSAEVQAKDPVYAKVLSEAFAETMHELDPQEFTEAEKEAMRLDHVQGDYPRGEE